MAKKITQKKVKGALKDKIFRPESPPSFLFRYADLAPWMSVVEHKPNRKGKFGSLYSIHAYQGETAVLRWDSIQMVSLKEAVAWANAHTDQAMRLWEEEV